MRAVAFKVLTMSMQDARLAQDTVPEWQTMMVSTGVFSFVLSLAGRACHSALGTNSTPWGSGIGVGGGVGAGDRVVDVNGGMVVGGVGGKAVTFSGAPGVLSMIPVAMRAAATTVMQVITSLFHTCLHRLRRSSRCGSWSANYDNSYWRC